MHYALIYEGVENYGDVRMPWRPAHVDLAREYFANGALVQAGGFLDPVDGSLLIFRGDSPSVAEEFAKKDPFVLNGVVKKWSVRPWNTIVGPDAAVPTIGV